MMVEVRRDASLGVKTTEVAVDSGMTLADIERVVIMETLKRQNFNRTRAARVLGIGIRTLQRKLKQYGQQLSTADMVNA